MFLQLRSLSHQGPGPLGALTAAAFAAGVLATATLGPLVGRTQDVRPAVTAQSSFDRDANSGVAYPAEVLRVLDGDTFEARVRVWPGMDVTTRVRLRGIDAPEMHARCPEERLKAEAARDALSRLLAQGNIGIIHVGIDKYGGRVDADVSTQVTANIPTACLPPAMRDATRAGGATAGARRGRAETPSHARLSPPISASRSG